MKLTAAKSLLLFQLKDKWLTYTHHLLAQRMDLSSFCLQED